MSDPNKVKYILGADGATGYCFDKHEIRKRCRGVESVVQPNTEEMGKANDALTGMTLGFGVGEKGEEITEAEYMKL